MSDASARILLVRLSAIGDVIHALPVMNRLRAARPNAFLAWVVEGRGAELLAGHPALDALVPVKKGWLKRPSSVLDLRRRLKALECDTVIDMQGLSKSAIAARLSGARRRIGFGGRDGRELSPWLNNERVVATATHVIDRNLELLGPLGISASEYGPTDLHFDLPEKPQDAAAAQALLYAGQLMSGFALINPGAGWPSKLWPPDRFAAVARYLGQRYSLPSLVVWAGAAEHLWAEQIVAAADGYARLAPQTTLCELASLARRATLFVSSDTGPLHIAAAVGTSCVGLFGPMPAERNGPYGSRHIAIQKATLSGNRRNRRKASDVTMRAIDVDDVTAACDKLLVRQELRRDSA